MSSNQFWGVDIQGDVEKGVNEERGIVKMPDETVPILDIQSHSHWSTRFPVELLELVFKNYLTSDIPMTHQTAPSLYQGFILPIMLTCKMFHGLMKQRLIQRRHRVEVSSNNPYGKISGYGYVFNNCYESRFVTVIHHPPPSIGNLLTRLDIRVSSHGYRDPKQYFKLAWQEENSTLMWSTKEDFDPVIPNTTIGNRQRRYCHFPRVSNATVSSLVKLEPYKSVEYSPNKLKAFVGCTICWTTDRDRRDILEITSVDFHQAVEETGETRTSGIESRPLTFKQL